MLDFNLYLIQRISALIMVPLVAGHIAVMIVAIQGGLSAAEILERTRGSTLWALFYGSFVLAVAVHAAIGLRGIIFETVKTTPVVLNTVAIAIFFGLLGLGMRAVWAVTFGSMP